MKRTREPTRPGEILNEEFLRPLEKLAVEVGDIQENLTQSRKGAKTQRAVH